MSARRWQLGDLFRTLHRAGARRYQVLMVSRWNPMLWVLTAQLWHAQHQAVGALICEWVTGLCPTLDDQPAGAQGNLASQPRSHILQCTGAQKSPIVSGALKTPQRH